MNDFVFFYVPSTGEIKMVVLNPHALLSVPGCITERGYARPGLDYWEGGGEPPDIDDPDAQDWRPFYIRALPARPSPFHVFNYTSKLWELQTELAWDAVRLEVAHRLEPTNALVMECLENANPVPSEVAQYRQALRDVLNQDDPLDIEWPVAGGQG